MHDQGGKIRGKTGWVLRNPKGQVIRNFVDTDSDNRVDQWSYFKDGVEVYRDIDSNHNGKADQCRWLNTAGTRLGIDKNEDRVIDVWEIISPEEVSSELVAAIRDNDKPRFERLLVSSRAGAPGPRRDQVGRRSETSRGRDCRLRPVHAQSKGHPSAVHLGLFRRRPAGTVSQGADDSTADITVYENVAAMVDTDGKPPSCRSAT